MLRLRDALALAALSAAIPALAQAQDETVFNPNDQATAPPATSTAQATPVTTGRLNTEKAQVTPELGVYSYGTPSNGTQARGLVGLGFDLNVLTTFVPADKRNDTWSRMYIGPQTGFFFTHTGSSSSNFFGTSATVVDAYAGANIMYIPVDLKVGYMVSDDVRISAHGGGNVLYQSINGTVNISNSSTFATAGATSSSWNIYPNVGADVEIAVERNVAILLRPDWTIAHGTSPFAGTLGVAIGMS